MITNATETLKFPRNGIGEQMAWAWNEKRKGHKLSFKDPINAKYCEIIAGRIGEYEYHTIQREGVSLSLTVF